MSNMRLIDANKLFEKVGRVKPRNKEHYKAIGEFMNMITNSETIDIEPSEDCISREYLKSFDYINKGNFNSVETIREWIDNAPGVVPSRATGKWIPASERLPKKGEGEEVLITVDALFRQLYVATYTYHGWDFVEGVFDDEKVLAWMPLPEPYRERKEDE